MPWDEWIELDRDFPYVHRVVEHRIQTRGDRLVSVNAAQPGVVPSGQAAGERAVVADLWRVLSAELIRPARWPTAEELVHELAEYLARRHPDVYRVARRPVSQQAEENGWYGDGKIKEVTIVPFGKTYDLEKEEPMRIARSL